MNKTSILLFWAALSNAADPVWFQPNLTATKNDGYVYGCAKAETEEKARNLAMNSLAAQIRILVENTTTSKLQEVSGNDDTQTLSDFSSETKSKVSEDFEGLETFRKADDADYVYLCLRLNKAEHERLSREKEAKASSEIAALVNEAAASLDSGKWIQAQASLNQAEIQMTSWEKRQINLKVDGQSLRGRMDQIALQLLGSPEFKNTSAQAVFTKGQNMTLPAQLQLANKSMVGLPFVFSVDNGVTWQKINTDANGQFQIPLGFVAGAKQISLKLDVGPLLKDSKIKALGKLSSSAWAVAKKWPIVEAAKEIRIEIGDCPPNQETNCKEAMRFFKDALSKKGFTVVTHAAIPAHKLDLTMDIRPQLDVGSGPITPAIITATLTVPLGNGQENKLQSTEKGLNADADAATKSGIKKAMTSLAGQLE